MRVALVGPLPPLRGGISHYNASLLKALRDAGHDLLPLSYKRLYPGFLFPGSSETDTAARAPRGALPLLVAWNPISWLLAIGRLRRFRPDRIIVQHWHPFFVPALCALLLFGRSKRSQVIAHNVLPHEKRLLGRLLNPFLFRLADRVHVGGREELQTLRKLVPSAQAEVASHPVYDRFDADARQRAELRSSMGVEPEELLIVHAGLVRDYKGLDTLLAAFDQVALPQLRLRVVGEFYVEEEPYRKQLETMKTRDRVVMENRYLPDDELGELLLAADVLVLPYRRATQSGMAMAALALGTPVIASRTGALPDVIRSGEEGLLFTPGSASELAECLGSFASKLDAWRSTREERKASIRHRYSWANLAARLIEEER